MYRLFTRSSGYYNRAIIFTGHWRTSELLKGAKRMRTCTNQGCWMAASFFNEGQRAKVTLRLKMTSSWRWENSSGTKPMTFTRVLDTPVFESKSGDKLTYHPFGDFS